MYDTVDEREYSERVLQRQEDDWIEDDGKFLCLSSYSMHMHPLLCRSFYFKG